HNINPSSFKTLQIGMSQCEVEAILGASAGNYSTSEVELDWERDLAALRSVKGTHMVWQTDDCFIMVIFDSNVVAMHYHRLAATEKQTLVASILRFLGLKKETPSWTPGPAAP